MRYRIRLKPDIASAYTPSASLVAKMRGIEVKFRFGFVFAVADLYGRWIRGQDGDVPG